MELIGIGDHNDKVQDGFVLRVSLDDHNFLNASYQIYW